MKTLINLRLTPRGEDDHPRNTTPVEADPIGHGLALHPSINVDGAWQVSDMTTGMSVGLPEMTRKDARLSARMRLVRACRDGLGATVDEVLERARAKQAERGVAQ
jgi:hypothetical protein